LLVAYRMRGQPAGYLGVAYGLPRGGFDVNLQLMMKLLGTSLATGLERVRLGVALASTGGAQ
jgi:GAF domain-containing protein